MQPFSENTSGFRGALQRQIAKWRPRPRGSAGVCWAALAGHANTTVEAAAKIINIEINLSRDRSWRQPGSRSLRRSFADAGVRNIGASSPKTAVRKYELT
jgi:hypothetical protein